MKKKEIIVDCRKLSPPEPMIKVLEAVSSMKEDEIVIMLHRKVPYPLFEKLKERGLKYEFSEIDGEVRVVIWK